MTVRNNTLLGIVLVVLFLFGLFSLIYLKFFGSNVLLIPGVISLVAFAILVVILAKKQQAQKRSTEALAFAAKYAFFGFFSNMFINNQNGMRFPKKFFAYSQGQEYIASLRLRTSSVVYSYALDELWSVTMSFSIMDMTTVELTCKHADVQLFSATVKQELFSQKMGSEIPFSYGDQQYTLHLSATGVSIVEGAQTVTVSRDAQAIVLSSGKLSPQMSLLLISVHVLLNEGSIFPTNMDTRNQL